LDAPGKNKHLKLYSIHLRAPIKNFQLQSGH